MVKPFAYANRLAAVHTWNERSLGNRSLRILPFPSREISFLAQPNTSVEHRMSLSSYIIHPSRDNMHKIHTRIHTQNTSKHVHIFVPFVGMTQLFTSLKSVNSLVRMEKCLNLWMQSSEDYLTKFHGYFRKSHSENGTRISPVNIWVFDDKNKAPALTYENKAVKKLFWRTIWKPLSSKTSL